MSQAMIAYVCVGVRAVNPATVKSAPGQGMMM